MECHTPQTHVRYINRLSTIPFRVCRADNLQGKKRLVREEKKILGVEKAMVFLCHNKNRRAMRILLLSSRLFRQFSSAKAFISLPFIRRRVYRRQGRERERSFHRSTVQLFTVYNRRMTTGEKGSKSDGFFLNRKIWKAECVWALCVRVAVWKGVRS